MTIEPTVVRIAKRIRDDITNRRGLREVFEEIDTETRKEIFETWKTIIREELSKQRRV